MKLKLIACKVLQREIGFLCAQSPNFIDITFLRQGYHNEPEKLNKILQEEIDKLDTDDDRYSCTKENGDFDAILLGYGLCSNGVVGLHSNKYDIVIPKAHDCITLFLGSKEKYRKYFDENPGTYWYSPGWVENTFCDDYYKMYYNKYIKDFDEDNAAYLAEIESGWYKHYKQLTYVEFPSMKLPDFRQKVTSYANEVGLGFDYIKGDEKLLADFLDGKWDEERFLIIKSGQTITPSYDEHIIKTK